MIKREESIIELALDRLCLSVLYSVLRRLPSHEGIFLNAQTKSNGFCEISVNHTGKEWSKDDLRYCVPYDYPL